MADAEKTVKLAAGKVPRPTDANLLKSGRRQGKKSEALEILSGEKRGRKAGGHNATTVHAKDAIALAAEKLGGAARLAEWAKESKLNERVFWSTIYTKLIPLYLQAQMNQHITIEHRIMEQADVFKGKVLDLVAKRIESKTEEGDGE